MINISLINGDSKASRAFEIALSNRAADICKLTGDEDADIGILDVDSYHGDEWKEVRDAKRYSTILLSDTALPGEVLFVKKPVRFSALIDLVCKTAKEKNNRAAVAEGASDAAGKIARVKKSNVVQFTNARTHFDPAKYIVGYLSEVASGKRNNNVVLFKWSEMWLLVDEKNKTASASTNRKILRHLSVVPLTEIPRRSLAEEEVEAFRSKAKVSLSVEDFLWLTVPFVSARALPEKFDPDREYMLRTWPNFTQYPSSTALLSVASYWAETPASVNDLCRIFKLPLTEVSSFITSCYLSGFLTCDGREVEMLPIETNEKNSSGVKGIFRKMLAKLG